MSELKTAMGWLALSMYLEGKKCVKCNFEWKSREDAKGVQPIGWYDGEVICYRCFRDTKEFEEKFEKEFQEEFEKEFHAD